MKRFRSSSRWHEGDGEYVTVCSCRELRKHHPDMAHDVIESIGRAKAKRTEFVVYPSLESFAGIIRRQTPWTDAKEREEIAEDSQISLEDLLELFSQ